MLVYAQCHCTEIPTPPVPQLILGFAILGLLFLGAGLIVSRWLLARWPRMTPARFVTLFALSVVVNIGLKANALTMSAFRVLLVGSLATVLVHAGGGVAVWLTRARVRPRTNRDIFEAACFFLPREVREAFWADWKERRGEMIAGGYGPLFQRCVFATMIGWEIAGFFEEEVREFLTGVMRPRP